jgi:hypothetical protein
VECPGGVELVEDVLVDPDLERLVTAWPRLPDILRKVISAIVRGAVEQPDP